MTDSVESVVRDAIIHNMDHSPDLKYLEEWAKGYRPRRRIGPLARPLLVAASVGMVAILAFLTSSTHHRKDPSAGPDAPAVNLSTSPAASRASGPDRTSTSRAFVQAGEWRDYTFTDKGAKSKAVISIPANWPEHAVTSCLAAKSDGVLEFDTKTYYAACHDGDSPGISVIRMAPLSMTAPFTGIDADRATESMPVEGGSALVGKSGREFIIVVADANLKMAIKSPDAEFSQKVLQSIRIVHQ